MCELSKVILRSWARRGNSSLQSAYSFLSSVARSLSRPARPVHLRRGGQSDEADFPRRASLHPEIEESCRLSFGAAANILLSSHRIPYNTPTSLRSNCGIIERSYCRNGNSGLLTILLQEVIHSPRKVSHNPPSFIAPENPDQDHVFQVILLTLACGEGTSWM